MVTFHFGSRRKRDKGDASSGGKLVITLFFLMFFLGGLFFEFMIVRDFVRTVETYGWDKTECIIMVSTVAERQESNSEPYKFEVSYEYTYKGKNYVSNRYKLNYSGSDEYHKQRRLCERYSEGMKAYCYVNPELAGEAVLKRQSLLGGFAILFPLIFVAIGGGGLYGIWFYRSKEKDSISAKGKSTKSISGKKRGKQVGVGFFAIFALAGFGFLIPFFIKPLFSIIDARGWEEVECRVISGYVRSHEGDDSTTYSVDILYEYEYDGRAYKSNRYSFFGGSSSGYSGKKEIVNKYLSAESPVCYVNPDEPLEAVLNRGFTWTMLFGLIPLVFVAVGVGGVIGVLRKSNKTTYESISLSKTSSYSDAGYYEKEDIGGEAIELKAKSGPVTKLLVIICVAAFWNGIVSVFVVDVVKGFMRGDPHWFLTIFMIPFVAIGLGLIYAVFHSFLALFNPRVKLKLRPGKIELGGAAELKWEIFGQVHRISEFSIKLIGREEATYRRGTDTHTDKETFCEMEVFSMSDWMQMQTGEIGVVMPSDTMHTFKANNNKVIWLLEVHGDIKRWPDVKDEYEITVLPASVN